MPLPELSDFPLNKLRELSENYRIVLASGSPRRRMFMERSGIPFVTEVAEIEEIFLVGEAPDRAAMRLAEMKARAVADRNIADVGPRLIIGSDTIVWSENEALGKPRDEAEARSMLQRLSGLTHTVYTAISLLALQNEKIQTLNGCAETDVTFNQLTAQQISEYVASGDPLDKAGAYGAQEHGAFLVDHISGELDTVIGFPRALVDELAGRALESLD